MTRLPERRTITDPMSLMDDFSAYMNRMMGPYFAPLATEEGAWTPSADVGENANDYHVDIDLPGVHREDITIDIEGQELTVSGDFRKEDHIESPRRSTRREGRFEFAVRLPHAVDADRCAAELKDGVLCLTVPKAASPGHKTIEIT
jgi:HSP20 family protein